MSVLVPLQKPEGRRYELITAGDGSLSKIGIMAGEDYLCALDEFYPGDFHVVDHGGQPRTLRTCVRPPNLIGRVIPPPFRVPDALDPLPPEGLHFETDANGNIVELDDALIKRCWGVEAKSCYGYGFINQIAPELRADFCYVWARAVLGGGNCHIYTEGVRADGQRIPLVVSAVRSKGIGERFRGWSGVTRLSKLVQVA